MSVPAAEFRITRLAREQWRLEIHTNGRLLLESDTLYRRQVGAERAILSAARAFGWGQLTLVWNVEGIEKVFLDEWLQLAPGLPTVRYVDDRLHPVARPELPAVGAS